MTGFAIAAAALGIGGIAAAGWLLWPTVRPPEPTPDPVDPSQTPDVAERLEALCAVEPDPDDDGRPWGQAPMVEGERRIGADLVPWDVLPLLVDGEVAWLVPLGSALLRAPGVDRPVLRGRRHGRAFHAVRLRDDVFLDLIEAGRLLPVIGVEAQARGVALGEIGLFADAEALREARGIAESGVGALAPWLMGGDAPRVVPEGTGASTFRIGIDGGALSVRAWMPEVAAGLRADRLRWAGVATWRRDGFEVRDVGATSEAVLAALEEAGDAREAWRWSREELLELGGVVQHLEREDIDVGALFDDAFADRRAPVPAGEDELVVAAAVLNWRGVVARRDGRTGLALAAFDAALGICGPEDDDTRADICFNRAITRLQHGMGGRSVAEVLADPPAPDLLDAALADLQLAARFHPGDPHAWSLQGLVYGLRGDAARAEDAWLQAATRTKDPDAHTRLLANARAARAGVVPAPGPR